MLLTVALMIGGGLLAAILWFIGEVCQSGQTTNGEWWAGAAFKATSTVIALVVLIRSVKFVWTF